MYIRIHTEGLKLHSRMPIDRCLTAMDLHDGQLPMERCRSAARSWNAAANAWAAWPAFDQLSWMSALALDESTATDG